MKGLEVDLVRMTAYADQQGAPSGTLINNLNIFDKRMQPLITAALEFDESRMTKELVDRIPDFQWLQSGALNIKAITKIDENRKLSDKIIATLDILLLAHSIYEVAKVPTVSGPSSSPPPPPGLGVLSSGPAAVVMNGGMSQAQIAEMLQAVGKLIDSGALDSTVIAGLGRLGDATGSPTIEVGKPEPTEMKGEHLAKDSATSRPPESKSRFKEVLEDQVEAARQGNRPLQPEGTDAISRTPNPRTSASDSPAEILRANMKRAGVEELPDHDAHHIVPESMEEAQRAQQILGRAHIKINDAINGVMLPRNAQVANEVGSAIHGNIHTPVYLRALTDRLEAAERLGTVRNTLRAIQEEIKLAVFPH